MSDSKNDEVVCDTCGARYRLEYDSRRITEKDHARCRAAGCGRVITEFPQPRWLVRVGVGGS